jgi:DNA repair exonuclease SbcCD ATPase subunit
MATNVVFNFTQEGAANVAADLAGVSTEVTELNGVLDQMKDKLKTLPKDSAEFKKLSNEVEAAEVAMAGLSGGVDTFRKQLKSATDEATKIIGSMQELKKRGLEGTESYKQLGKQLDEVKKRMGTLKDQVGDLNRETANLGSDTRGLDRIISAASLVTSGFAIAQGAAALFGKENSKVQESLLKVNAAMSILMGLQQIQNELSKQESIFTSAAAAAKRGYAAAVGTATGAMKAFRLALIATGIGAVVVLIGALIVNWERLTDAIGLSNKQLRDAKKAHEDLNKAIEERNTKQDRLERLLKASGKAEGEILAIRKQNLQITMNEINAEILRLQRQRKALDILGASNKAADVLSGRSMRAVKASRELSIQIEEYQNRLVDIDIALKETDQSINKTTESKKEFKKETQKVAINLTWLQKLLARGDVALKDYKSAIEELSKPKQGAIPTLTEAFSELGKELKKLDRAFTEFDPEIAAQLDALAKARADALKRQSEEERRQRLGDVKYEIRLIKDALAQKIITEKEAADQIRAIRIKRANAAFEVALQISSTLSQFQAQANQQELADLQEKKNKGLISEKQYAKEVAKIQEKQAKQDKAAALIQAKINAALAITALVAKFTPPSPQFFAGLALIIATTAANIALIAKQKIPSAPGFKKGVIDLKGPGSTTSDSIDAKLSRGESVMTAKETNRYKPVLTAIRKGVFEANYIPVLKPNSPAPMPISGDALRRTTSGGDWNGVKKELELIREEMIYNNLYTKQGNGHSREGLEYLRLLKQPGRRVRV